MRDYGELEQTEANGTANTTTAQLIRATFNGADMMFYAGVYPMEDLLFYAYQHDGYLYRPFFTDESGVRKEVLKGSKVAMMDSNGTYIFDTEKKAQPKKGVF